MTKTATPAPEPAPGPLRRAARHAYRRATTATAPLRLAPGFLMIGVQRCGTTSLFQALAEHPQVMRPAFRKGVYYFDLNYHRGDRWYLGHFPVRRLARRKAARYGPPVAFEASGYYIYHPFALDRIAADLPSVKLVVMLRDPVERAYSAYKHEYARGYEPERSFERALELEDGRLAGEVDRMRADPRYESLSHRHHSYRHRGHYAEQLERAFALFPRTQVHVVPSEAFFAEPAQEYRRLLEFLGLHPFGDVNFGRYKARPGAAMAPATAGMLRAYYTPHDERLAKLLGREPPWPR
jgi:hypothetical protein